MAKQTPLHDRHLAAGARMVDFGGWEMPIDYGSQIEEHHRVRRGAGMFDVSHMTPLDLKGAGVRDFLRRLLANDVDKLKLPGKALYSCMLMESGGVVDDLIVYYMADDWYRMVVNAATRDKDLAWLAARAEGFGLELTELDRLAMVAIQGPEARGRAAAALPAAAAEAAATLEPFQAAAAGEWFVARTGYTGEDGLEIMLPAAAAGPFWDALLAAGVSPCGLGARDTLRLEAGMSLYGQDLDEVHTPLECGLAWTVDLKDPARDFVGRQALEAQKEAGVPWRLVGLILEGRGVLRAHQRVVTAAGEGETTSGSFAPTLQRAVALARVPAAFAGDSCRVEIRGKELEARVVKPPFVRNGEALHA